MKNSMPNWCIARRSPEYSICYVASMPTQESWIPGQLRKLLAGTDARIVAFADMPLSSHKSIADYMSSEGTAWTLPSELDDRSWEWDEALPDLIDRYGHVLFGYAAVPFQSIITALQQAKPHFTADNVRLFGHEDFATYHAHYMAKVPYAVTVPGKHGRMVTLHRGQPPGGSEVWPIFLDGVNGEVLQDGWHRLHQYYAQGLQSVPAIFFPTNFP